MELLHEMQYLTALRSVTKPTLTAYTVPFDFVTRELFPHLNVTVSLRIFVL